VASIDRDLERLIPAMLALPSVRPDLQRRTLAAFPVEVARAGIGSQVDESEHLLDAIRERLIQTHTPPDAFDRHWHLAAVALLEAVRDHAALEREATAALQQFPDEPRFVLAHAIAAEIRASVDLEAETESDGAREARDLAARRLEDARAVPAIGGEAELRLGYLDVQVAEHASTLDARRSRLAAALDRLDAPESHVAP
jgi:hypothetical protein